MSKQIAGMSTEEIAQIAKMFVDNKDEIKALIETFRPVVHDALGLAMDTIGPEFEAVVVRLALGSVAVRKAVFDEYIRLDFTRDETIALMLNDTANVQKFNDAVSKATK